MENCDDREIDYIYNKKRGNRKRKPEDVAEDHNILSDYRYEHMLIN